MPLRLPFAALLLLSASAYAAEPGKPPLSAQTAASGGPLDAAQKKVTFDTADLQFEVDPEREVINATATLVFTAKERIDRLVVDLDKNFTVTAVTVDGVDSAGFSNPEGRMTIKLVKKAAKDAKLTVKITYGGRPHTAVRAPWDGGFVWAKTPDGSPWIATAVQGEGCDLFWPCIDYPTYEPQKVTLHITVPKGLKAPSNGKLLGVDHLDDGRSTWNWEVAHPNPYTIALNVGPYEELTGTYKSKYGNEIPMYYWYLPGEKEKAEKLFAEFAPTLDFYESVVGPYPWANEKVGVVETPHKGMEHQTINAYGNGYAKAPEGFDWLFHHEFSHEWFANQLTAANWDDYWLHEGFGSYMQPLYGQWREGDARYAVMLEAQRNQITNRAPIVRDRVLTEEEVYEPSKGGAGTDIYYKGSWTLHTLRWLIGNRAFFDSVRRLVYGRRDPKPGNFVPRYGSTREFEAIVREESGRDLSWFFDTYLRDRALPELVTTRDGDTLRLTWRTERARVFAMPVELTVDGVMRRVQLPDGSATVTVPPGAHVVIDPAARILRRSVAVEEYQQWRQQQQKPR